MKKLLLIALCTVLCTGLLAGCGGNDPEEKRYAFISVPGNETEYDAKVFAGLTAAAEARPCLAEVYEAEEGTDEAAAAAVKAAVKAGAKLIVLSGDAQSVAAYEGQKANKKRHFILVNARPMSRSAYDKAHSETEETDEEEGAELKSKDRKSNDDGMIPENTAVIRISYEEAGFLAGYALVSAGYTNLGFMGGADSELTKAYGNGFIKGADQAANERLLSSGSITVRYAVTGDDGPSPRKMNQAMTWYNDGTQVIYAPQKGVGKAVEKGAEESERGLYATAGDVEGEISQRRLLTTTLDYQTAVRLAAQSFETEDFPGGEETSYGIASGCVGLQADYSRMTTFTDTTYSVFLTSFANGRITVPADDFTAGTSCVIVSREG